MDKWALFTRFGLLLLSTRCGEIGFLFVMLLIELPTSYVISRCPVGCVGRGVRLGSEGSSVGGGGGGGVGGGGVWKFGVKKIKKKKNLKIQIHSAQNVGKVWISRKKIFLALFGAI